MALLSKDQIFTRNDMKTADVDVPEWGGTVRVKALTGIERDAFESALLSSNKNGSVRVDMRNARARLVAFAVVDETGERVFSDDDMVMLGTKSASALDRIYDVAAALAGIGDGDIDELLGNSGTGPSAGSTSDSP